MRPHHALRRPRPSGSAGWLPCSAGQDANPATNGPATIPMPTPTPQGIGSTASSPMRTAPTSATIVTTSMPGTHCAVTVDLAIASVSRNKSPALQTTPPGSSSRVRRTRRSGKLTDADCISSPHEAGEVVALTHDIQVYVLPEIEGGVLVGTAEARAVEEEDDHRRAAASNRLQQAHPGLVGARRDHGDGAARQPANPVPGKRLRQRRAAVGGGHREVVEDDAVLPDRSVRLQDRPSGIVGDQAHLPAATVDLRRHGSGQAHRIFDGRLLTLAAVDVAVQVEQDPEVGGQRLLEGLRHQAGVTRRQWPVDAAEAVTGDVVTHAARVGRTVGPRYQALRAADLLGA